MYKTKILLVDDKPENILALRNLIASPDVEVLSATSGDDALALLLQHEIALAMLDVQMPVISGFELARLMRSAERSRSIPIIFVTAGQGAAATIFEGYEQGAVDFLIKPLDPHIVRSKVRVFVELDQKSHVLKQKLDEVERLRSEAETANRAKSRFLANMSHEIRTPLGAVIGFAELLTSHDTTEDDANQYVTAILRNSRLLLTLIDDILDLSKIEADRIEIECVPMDLVDLVEDLRSVHGQRAADKDVRFKIKARSALPRMFTSDPVRLTQVLNNIIGNAVKFTDTGEVELSIDLTTPDEDRDGKRFLRFTVRDTGCGLSREATERLFQPFMQADSSTTRKFGGTGLGLVISRRLARLLGGDVCLIESIPSSGCTFVVSIDPGRLDPADLVPASSLFADDPGDAKSTAPPLGKELAGISVLVVDDALDNQLLLRKLLEYSGASTQVANDGCEALEAALGANFDIVLMDIQMPEMDGYEAVGILRAKGYQKPVIALTAHAMKEELQRCLAAGFDHYLSKPVSYEELVETLIGYLPARPQIS